MRLTRARLTLPRQRPSQRQSQPEPAAGPPSPGPTGPDTRAAAQEGGRLQPSGPPDHQTVRDEDMANVTAAEVKRLREHTAAGMMDCKRALEEADGDFDAAVEILRLKGAKDVSKRAARTAANGLVAAELARGSLEHKPADRLALLSVEIRPGVTAQQLLEEASASLKEKLLGRDA